MPHNEPQRYVQTPSTGFLHRPDCDIVTRQTERGNTWPVITADQIEWETWNRRAFGVRSCAFCNPGVPSHREE